MLEVGEVLERWTIVTKKKPPGGWRQCRSRDSSDHTLISTRVGECGAPCRRTRFSGGGKTLKNGRRLEARRWRERGGRSANDGMMKSVTTCERVDFALNENCEMMKDDVEVASPTISLPRM